MKKSTNTSLKMILILLSLFPLLSIAEFKISNSITFILGKDVDVKNEFYHMAREHFLYHPEFRTEIVIDNYRYLEEVITYIRSNPPPNGLYWNNVNIVSHSSRLGLDIPILKGHGRATSKAWEKLIITKPELTNGMSPYLNSETIITVWGCAFGKQREHLALLGNLFRGDKEHAIVRSSKNRIIFFEDKQGIIQKRFAQEFVLYSKNPIDDEEVLISLLKEKYKNAIDWEKESPNIQRNESITTQSEFRISFEVSTKILKSYRSLKQFFRQEPSIVKKLDELGIKPKDMKFTIRERNGKNTTILGITYESALLVNSSNSQMEIASKNLGQSYF